VIRRWVDADGAEWLKETAGVREYYRQFGERLPAVLLDELNHLERRLTSSEAIPTNNPLILQWVEESKRLCRLGALLPA